MNRRQFNRLALLAATRGTKLFAATDLSQTLRESMTRRRIPAVVAMTATADTVTYTGAFGKRDEKSGVDVKPDSMFAIASMTKAITATAALQLVEQGKMQLHEPVSKYLPELGKLDVLTGFDSAGKPVLHPATKPVTLHHLLTHTSGFAYDTWDESMLKYNAQHGGASGPQVAPLTPLIFEPGTRWQYGTSMDWAGRLVEKVSGLTLEQYFQKQHSRSAGYAGHDVHLSGGEVRPSGDLAAAAEGRDAQGGCARRARGAEGLQRRRRTVFDSARLRAVHADDPEPRARDRAARRSCRRRRSG